MSFPEEETIMPRRKKDQSADADELLTEGEGTENHVSTPAPARRAALPGLNGGPRPPLDQGRKNAIEKTLTDLTKRFGDGAVMRLGEAKHMNVESIPTG